MTFIEWLFSFSPDAGTGVTELLLLLAPMVAAMLLVRARRKARI